MSLATIRGSNGKCGPAALAAVLHVTTDEAARLIRKYRRVASGQVHGVYPFELRGVLEELQGRRVVSRWYERGNRLTLAAWLRRRSRYQVRRPALVFLARHVIAVQGRKAVDNQTREPRFIRRFPGRRRRVHEVLWIMD